MTAESVIGAALGLAVGGVFGFLLGRWLRPRSPALYWLASAAALVGGVVLVLVGQLSRFTLVAGLGVGLLTGGVNGIKYGAGKLSQWRTRRDGDGDDDIG